MDAIKFIKGEHRKIKSKLMTISKSSRAYASKKKMFANLSKFLVVHEAMEEKKWYPHFKNDPKVKKIVKLVVSQEKAAGKALKQLKKLKTEAAWEKGFVKIKKDVLHHAATEESKLFPKVRTILDKKELNKIGISLRKFRDARLKK